MNNIELFKQVKSLNLPIGEYAIFGSGPMGIRNLREMHDIDLVISERVYEDYKNKEGWEKKEIKEGNEYYQGLANYGMNIEMWKDWYVGWNISKLIEDAEIIDGMPFVRIETLLKWKKFRAREKDIKDVEIIEKYLTENKRKVSVLAPYKKENGLVHIFLQKRSDDAEREPGMFGFFGGGADGNENSEEALLREIKEELDIVLERFNHFGTYYLPKTVVDVFVTEVGNNFEKEIKILEGDYGKWFTEEDFERERDIITGDLRILEELYGKLSKNKHSI
jgi:8-oxo-dGTP pyrophosphatase MutT (NUDIX family)